jgi:hypothetical protein
MRCTYNGGAATDVDVAVGTYHWGCDGGATDFAVALKSALETAFVATTFTIKIYNVNSASTTYGDGRIKITEAAHDFTFEWLTETAYINFDSRILGFSGLADADSTAKNLNSPWVHRYGWYPQTDPVEDLIRTVANTSVTFSSARYRSGVDWGEWPTIGLAWDHLNSTFVRTAAAADSARNANLGLTVGDLNCSFERFGLDLCRSASREWRYYPDCTAYTTSDYHGPYVYQPDSPLWLDPLSSSQITQRAGELWMVSVSGTQAVS